MMTKISILVTFLVLVLLPAVVSGDIGKEIASFMDKHGIPEEMVVLCISALPIVELRGAIPIAIFTFDFPWAKSYIISVLGNLIPVVPILLLLESVAKFSRKYRVFDKFFEWLFLRTEKKGKIVEEYETIGLMLFVSIPLPITGAWTGCVAAVLFALKKRYSLIAITLGVLIAGCIVTTFCLLGKVGGVLAGIALLALATSAVIGSFKRGK